MSVCDKFARVHLKASPDAIKPEDRAEQKAQNRFIQRCTQGCQKIVERKQGTLKKLCAT